MSVELVYVAVDLSKYRTPVVVSEPMPKIDFETKGPKKDPDGNVLFIVGLTMVRLKGKGGKRPKPQVWDVQFTCPLVDIVYGAQVEIDDLSMTYWKMDTTFDGVTYEAEGIKALSIPARPAALAAPASGPAARGKVGD